MIPIDDIFVLTSVPTSGAKVFVSVVIVIRVICVNQLAAVVATEVMLVSAITANGLMVVCFKRHAVVSVNVILTAIAISCVVFTAIFTPVHFVSTVVEHKKSVVSSVRFAPFAPVEVAVSAVLTIDFAVFVVIVVVIAFIYEFITFVASSETVFGTIVAPYFFIAHNNILTTDLLKTIGVVKEVVVFFFSYFCYKATTVCTVNAFFIGIFIHFVFLLIVSRLLSVKPLRKHTNTG